MSKQIKQMEMDHLKQTFQDVRDLVVLSVTKQGCNADNQVRAALRKKNIRFKMVKNSLARRVFDDLGIKVERFWEGSTVLAWGSSSVADLTKELDALIKKNDKLKIKGAVAEGLEITFQQALAMPTRAEAIGRIVSLALAPASRLVSQILAPASTLAGQIKSIGEKGGSDGPAAPEGAPAG
jgi:large subunit ribosomal protein L10